jgi:hypothetical protein
MRNDLISRPLISCVRRHRPERYAEQTRALKGLYAQHLMLVSNGEERRALGQQYRRARIRMMLRIVGEILNDSECPP